MSTEKKPLTILVVPVNAVGHTNACAGATRSLLFRGHRVIFLLEKAFRSRLAPLGFEEFIYALPKQSETSDASKPGDTLAKSLEEHQLVAPNQTTLEKLEHWRRLLGSPDYQRGIVALNEGVKKALKAIKPDLIYYDGNWLAPAIYYSGLPYIKNISVVPSFYEFEEGLVPGGSGLPSDGPQTEWPLFEDVRQRLVRSRSFNDLVESLGYQRYPEKQKAPIHPTRQLMTVYAYPEELNHRQISCKEGWFNLEVFQEVLKSPIIKPLENLLPKDFLEDDLEGRFSGKLVFLSMGSQGSVNIELMKRLLGVLSVSNHKYIVSKGPRHQEYSLPRQNMTGDRYLPQTDLLPHCHLVITHGGNNTVTETFAVGVPMLVLPLCFDQIDNAQRLAETGYGARLDPFTFGDQELLDTVDRLLLDANLRNRCREASRRIAESNHQKHGQLAERIEQLMMGV